MSRLSSTAGLGNAGIFLALRRCFLASFLLVTIASQSQAQDKTSNVVPDKLKDAIIVDPSQPDTTTYISDKTTGDIHLRNVARPDPADPYRHIVYLLAWRQAATGKLPVVITLNSLPETPKIDMNLWQNETKLKQNGTDGYVLDHARRGYLAVMAFSNLKSRLESEGPNGCDYATISSATKKAADDIERLLDLLRNEPEADMSHIVIYASGAPAISALALATRHVDGLDAVINVSGGLSLGHCDPIAVNKIVGRILSENNTGRPIPSLWLYADNDSTSDQFTVSGWREAYMKAGRVVSLAFIAMPGEPGYLLNFIPSGAVKMAPRINAFLDHLGLPAFHQTDIDKLAAKLGNANFRDLAREYILGPGNKALAVSQSGKWVSVEYSDWDASTAVKVALRDCTRQSGGEVCHILMLNNDYQR